MGRPDTLGALKNSGFMPRSVKREVRENLVKCLREKRPVFPGVVGYERTVVPQICNALLSGHDFILLGLRGQAKTRILRGLPTLLDEWSPVIAGGEIPEDPFAPITTWGQAQLAQHGDALPIRWLSRAERYQEKLATPDVTISDLIGDVDPIKAATRKLAFADPEVIHFGIVPRTNRGIFAINELPDLQARIQVGLLNILEEGDIQIRGFPIRMPLDVLLVFSANPEDYTNRGNIITPLRDRIASQILTHYPRTLEESLAITGQEAWIERGGAVEVAVPEFVRILVEEVAFQARRSEFVDQGSGVSARMTISLLENVISNAERRGLIHGEESVTARVSDVLSASSAITGKVELVYEGEREGAAAVADHLVGRAVKEVFEVHFPDALGTQQRKRGAAGGADPSAGGPDDGAGEGAYRPILDWFRQANTVDVTDEISEAELEKRLGDIPGLQDVVRRHLSPAGRGEEIAAMELVLEGLHQSSALSREEIVGGRVYRDVFDEMARSLRD